MLELFAKEKIQSRAGKNSPLAIIVEERKFPGALPGYKEGLFAVQDEASQAAVMMLDPKPGDVILDACSAPGTKTLEIFQLMQKTGRLVSADISEAKLGLIKNEAERLGLEGFEILAQDLTQPIKLKKQELFDKILIDAPCSGLGTIRRHPEIKWQRTPEDILKLAALQKKLAENLSRYVKTGGTLVYSTCTFTIEENREVVAALIDSGAFEIDDPAPILPESAQALIKDKILQALPNRHGTDGFTAFRLRKVNNIV